MTLKEHVINAVAAAAAIGLGSTVVGVKINDASQNDRIARLEALSSDVNGLRADLNRVDKHLSQIDGRFQGEHDDTR